MITFTEGQNKFNFRVAGIAVHLHRILLHTTLQDDFWNLPGGRVEFQESTDQALIREIREELGIDIQLDKLLYVNEDFFEYARMKYHEIGFYYTFSFPEGHEILDREGEFPGIEDGGRLIFKWFTIEELQGLSVYPVELKTDIMSVIDGSADLKHRIHQP